MRSNVDRMKENITDDREKEILFQAKNGDQEAFSWLYQRYYSGACAKAKRILMGRVDTDEAVEDAVQEAFSRCFMRINEIDDDFGPYFNKAVVNCAINEANKGYRSNGLKDENGDSYKVRATTFSALENESEDGFLDRYDDASVSKDISSNPDLLLEQKELERYVREILNELTTEQQNALVLHNIEGYSIKETAAILGTSEQNIKNWCFQGQKKANNMADEIAKRDGIELRTATRAIAPIAFFMWMFYRSTEAYAAEIKVPVYDAKKFAAAEAKHAKTGSVGMASSTKVIGIIAGVVVIGGVIAGGVFFAKSHKDEQPVDDHIAVEEQKDVEEIQDEPAQIESESQEIETETEIETEEVVEVKQILSDSSDTLYIAGDWLAADGSELSVSMYTDEVEDGSECGNVRGIGDSSYDLFNTEQNIYTLAASDGRQYTLVANANSPEENARENTAEKAQTMNDNADPALSGIYQPIEVIESFGKTPATSMDLFVDGEYVATYYIQYFYVS